MYYKHIFSSFGLIIAAQFKIAVPPAFAAEREQFLSFQNGDMLIKPVALGKS